MKILVTGGAGFIGSHTVVELIAAGHEPIIIDNFSNSNKSVLDNIRDIAKQDIVCYEHDYSDRSFLDKIFQKEAIEGVIHFAAYKAVGESVAEPLKYYKNNVAGFVTLLEATLAHGVYDFVFSSSAAVYGNVKAERAKEESPILPSSPYGWSKYMDETILRDVVMANKQLRGVALRYFNVIGAHDSGLLGELPKGKPQNLLPIIVQAAAGQTPPFTIFGTDYSTPDGTCQRDYIHVVDLAKAHVKSIQSISKNKNGKYSTYNIGTGKPTSVLELINAFEEINHVKVPYTLGKRRPGDPKTCYAVVDKANRELGWKATKTIEDAVRDAWRWQKSLI